MSGPESAGKGGEEAVANGRRRPSAGPPGGSNQGFSASRNAR